MCVIISESKHKHQQFVDEDILIPTHLAGQASMVCGKWNMFSAYSLHRVRTGSSPSLHPERNLSDKSTEA